MERDEHYEEKPYFHGPMRILGIIGMVIAGLAMAVLLAFLFGWLVMYLWNLLMPAIFGLKAITYWQAFGLCILAKLFFGGHGWHGSHRSDKWSRRGWKKHWGRHSGRNWDDWAPAGDYGNWRYYDEYWKNEGKAAFEAYLAKNKEENK
jgi:hypothetical protein